MLLEPDLLRLLERLDMTIRRPTAGAMQGERRSPRRGESVEFADYRAYTPGDDIRRIDWNLYARNERFFLRLFVAEEETTLHLLVDTSASMDFGDPDKLSYARRLAAAFGYIALSHLDRATVTAFGQGAPTQLAGARGRAGAVPLFGFLEKLQPAASGDLVDSCQRYARATRGGGPLLLCSDLLDDRWQEALTALTTRAFSVVVAHILAPQELRPDLDGDFRLLDAEGGPPMEITADAETLQRYNTRLTAWQTQVADFCTARGMAYVPVDTSTPLADLITGELRRRGVVQA